MSVAEALETRRQEREALLERIITRIREDKRVVAAWLTGSLGRGDGDDLSDIDLWIAVSDNYSRYVVAGRQEFVQRVETPLLVKEAPQNAPPDGGYLLTLFRGTYGPHQVDWYWQPQSKVRIPADARVLFDLVGLPSVEASEVSAAQRTEGLSDRIAFFWAMIGIAAKKVARQQLWAALGMIGMVKNTLSEVRQGLGKSDAPGTLPDVPPCAPEQQLQLLRALAQEMRALTPEIVALGGDPSEAAAVQMLDFFDLMETLLRDSQQHGKSG